MKKYIIGFIIGAMFSTIPINAAIEEYICYKANYRVMLNGEEYINTESPILDCNGNTYYPKNLLEKAGLNVTWNAELNQFEITLNPTIAQNVAKEEKNMYITQISKHRKVYPIQETTQGRYIDIKINNVNIDNSISIAATITNKSDWDIVSIKPTLYLTDDTKSGVHCEPIQLLITPKATITKTITINSAETPQFLELLFMVNNDKRPEFRSAIENFTWKLN